MANLNHDSNKAVCCDARLYSECDSDSNKGVPNGGSRAISQSACTVLSSPAALGRAGGRIDTRMDEV